MRTPSIKKLLREANIDTTYITMSSREIEVYIPDDEDATDALSDKVIAACKPKYELGGYQSGFGSWCLSEQFTPIGDWNDKSSYHHY